MPGNTFTSLCVVVTVTVYETTLLLSVPNGEIEVTLAASSTPLRALIEMVAA
jgi:hypothetical protein